MNILHVTSHMRIGGIPRYVITLSKALGARGHQVCVASSGGELVDELQRAGVEHVSIADLGTRSELNPKLWREVGALRALIRRRGIDVVHAHTRVCQVVSRVATLLERVPLVTTCHGLYSKRLGRRLYPCWGNHVVAISESVARWLRDVGAPAHRIATVLNGIDASETQWAVSPEAQEAFRRAAGLNGQPVIGIVGRVVAVKGHEWLLQAFERLVEDGVPGQLLIVGDGPDRSGLEAQVRRRSWGDRVHFAQSVLDVRVPLSVMDVVAVPSLWDEPFGLVVLEAMAAGRPVVASRTGAIPEILRHRETGLLVDRSDVSGLAAALRSLLENGTRRRQMGAAGAQTVRRNFSSERMADEIERVYAKVLE